MRPISPMSPSAKATGALDLARSAATLFAMKISWLFLLLATAALAQTPAAPAAGKIPAVRVQIVIGTQQQRVGGGYTKKMEINPKVTIEGASRLVPLPAFDATLLVITMNTKAKYVGNTEAFNVLTAEKVPLAAAANGNLRPITFEGSSVTYDSYRDASNEGGQVYKYYVFGLVEPETHAIVDFQTNDQGCATFCKTHPEKRDELLGLKKGAKFPAEFK